VQFADNQMLHDSRESGFLSRPEKSLHFLVINPVLSLHAFVGNTNKGEKINDYFVG